MSTQLDQIKAAILLEIKKLNQSQAETQAEFRRIAQKLKFAAKMAELDASRNKMEAELDAAKSAWAMAIASVQIAVCGTVSAGESEEEMAVLEAKLDNLAGLLSKVSADVQSIHARSRDFDP